MASQRGSADAQKQEAIEEPIGPPCSARSPAKSLTAKSLCTWCVEGAESRAEELGTRFLSSSGLSTNEVTLYASTTGLPSSARMKEKSAMLPNTSTVLKELSCRRIKLVIRDVAPRQRKLSAKTLCSARLREGVGEK